MSRRPPSLSILGLGDISLLRVHARWIIAVTLLTVASAVVVAWLVQRPEYRTEAKVLVGARLPSGGGPLAPDMETEVQVATSGVVLSAAARDTGTSPAYLRKRLSVTVPADSTVLRLRYADGTAEQAKVRAAAIAEAYITYRVGQASLLSAATAPRSATGPDYLLVCLAGLTVGVLAGVGGAFVRDRLDDRLRGPREFESITGISVVTCVPVHGSLAAESYRFLRTRLVQADPEPDRADGAARGPVVVTVTSAARDDGAADAAANVAAALARGGRRVVLICPARQGSRLSSDLDGDAGPGLPGVLRGHAALHDALRDSAVDGLTLLPRGAVGSDLAELLDARSLRRLVGQLPADVEFVVVLSPPVLTTAESLIWSDAAHEVVLVATVGASTRRELAAAARELRRTRGHLLGGVLYAGPLPDLGDADVEPATHDDRELPIMSAPEAGSRR